MAEGDKIFPPPVRAYRPGSGPITSPASAKEFFGRASFQRAGVHQGERSNPTEYAVNKRIGVGRAPTKLEMNLVFEDNASDYKIFKNQGMSDQQIFEILNKR